MVALLLLSILAAAVVRSEFIPGCASTCVGEAIGATLCSSADTPCICDSKDFMPSLHSCIEFNCEEEEQQDALARADQFCAVVQPHGGLRARDAEPEPAPEAEVEVEERGQPQARWNKNHHAKCRQSKYPFWSAHQNKCVSQCKSLYELKNKACVPKPSKNNHPKCKYSKEPFWNGFQKKCVKHCPKGYLLKDKECKPEPNKHHHPYCQHSPNPYWCPNDKKCVKQCKPGYGLVGKECHPHKPTTMKTHTTKPAHYPTSTHHTPPHYTKHTTHKPHSYPTPTRYSPTVTPTAYY